MTADIKNRRSFFVSATVINRYKKLKTSVMINHFSSSARLTTAHGQSIAHPNLFLPPMMAAPAPDSTLRLTQHRGHCHLTTRQHPAAISHRPPLHHTPPLTPSDRHQMMQRHLRCRVAPLMGQPRSAHQGSCSHAPARWVALKTYGNENSVESS
jgi:hypothetical protein